MCGGLVERVSSILVMLEDCQVACAEGYIVQGPLLVKWRFLRMEGRQPPKEVDNKFRGVLEMHLDYLWFCVQCFKHGGHSRQHVSVSQC